MALGHTFESHVGETRTEAHCVRVRASVAFFCQGVERNGNSSVQVAPALHGSGALLIIGFRLSHIGEERIAVDRGVRLSHLGEERIVVELCEDRNWTSTTPTTRSYGYT